MCAVVSHSRLACGYRVIVIAALIYWWGGQFWYSTKLALRQYERRNSINARSCGKLRISDIGTGVVLEVARA